MARSRGCSGRMSRRPSSPRQLRGLLQRLRGGLRRTGVISTTPDDRARLSACLAAVEACLVPLRVGLFEAMTREAK